MLNLFKKKTEEAVKRSKETWFGKITRLFERSSIEKETWEELEELLIAADTGVDTATALTRRVKERVSKEKISDVQQVRAALMQEMASILKVNGKGPAVTASPQIVLVVGVNGTGKTTSIAKLGYNFKRDGNKVMLAAADTFRAAAIDQLKWWGERIEAEVIAHQQGADPGAVVFDALQAAKSRGVQVVIVDTAGRLHTKFNLMEELKKIRRVIQQDRPIGSPRDTAGPGRHHRAERTDPGEVLHRGGGGDRHLPDQAGRHRQGRHRAGHLRPTEDPGAVHRHGGESG